MSNTLTTIKQLALAGQVRISEHDYDELVDDDLTAREILEGLPHAVLVEDYPGYPKGACVLVLQHDSESAPVHAVCWGIPKGHDTPAVLVTAYRPDPARWNATYMERRP